MAWPASVLTREIVFGKAVILETGADLSLRTVTRASRSLVSLGEGFRMESLVAQYETSDPGEVVAFELPVTNQPGWADAASRMGIEVGEDEHTHLYTTTLTIYSGTAQVKQYTIGPYPIPMGEGPIDGDTMLVPSETQSGALVPLPDVWAEIVADANALLNLRGEPNGIATLDGAGVVPETQLPERLSEDALKNTIGEGIDAANLVGSEAVRRILPVPVGEPLPILQDGDWVIRVVPAEAATYTTVFGDFPLSSGPTFDGVSLIFGTEVGTIIPAPGATNDLALHVTGGDYTCFVNTELLDNATHVDTEVLCRFRSNTGGDSQSAAAFFRVQDVDNFYWGRHSSASGGMAQAGLRTGGVSSTLSGTVHGPLDSGTWYFNRSRMQGEYLYTKIWKDGDPEPASWEATALSLAFQTGVPGVGRAGPGSMVVIDWMVFATGGLTAVAP